MKSVKGKKGYIFAGVIVLMAFLIPALAKFGSVLTHAAQHGYTKVEYVFKAESMTNAEASRLAHAAFQGYGRGDPRSLERLREAAKGGNNAAQTWLGGYDFIYSSYRKAFYWYHRAAEDGYGPAEFNLGALYIFGSPLPTSYRLRDYWLNKAAAQGYQGQGWNHRMYDVPLLEG